MPMKNMYIGTINPNPQFDQYLGTAMPYGKGSTPTPKWWEAYGVLADFVISNGTDNYIDTDVSIQGSLVIEFDLEYLSIGNKESSLFGAADTTAPREVIEAGSLTSPGVVFYGYAGTWTQSGFTASQNKRYSLKFVLVNGSQQMYVDGALVKTSTSTGDITRDVKMYLFARNLNGTVNNMIQVKLHSAKVSTTEGSPYLLEYNALHVTKKAITDRAGKVHPVGSYVLIDNVREDVPATFGSSLGGGQALYNSIMELNELGIQPTTNLETNSNTLTQMGVK